MAAVSCSGLHCAGCGAGTAVPPAALAGLFGLAWVAGHLAEVIAVSAACGVLSVAAVMALVRWGDRRDARHAARGPLLITRAPAPPQVTHAPPPAIEQHIHLHFADGRQAARVIRQVLPGVIAEGE